MFLKTERWPRGRWRLRRLGTFDRRHELDARAPPASEPTPSNRDDTGLPRQVARERDVLPGEAVRAVEDDEQRMRARPGGVRHGGGDGRAGRHGDAHPLHASKGAAPTGAVAAGSAGAGARILALAPQATAMTEPAAPIASAANRSARRRECMAVPSREAA